MLRVETVRFERRCPIFGQVSANRYSGSIVTQCRNRDRAGDGGGEETETGFRQRCKNRATIAFKPKVQ